MFINYTKFVCTPENPILKHAVFPDPDGAHYLSDLDSSLFLTSGCPSAEAPVMKYRPKPENRPDDQQQLVPPTSPPLQYSDGVSFLASGQPGIAQFYDNQRPHSGTLDHRCRAQNTKSPDYSIYHTCARRPVKKKVTIKEKPDDESEV